MSEYYWQDQPGFYRCFKGRGRNWNWIWNWIWIPPVFTHLVTQTEFTDWMIRGQPGETSGGGGV